MASTKVVSVILLLLMVCEVRGWWFLRKGNGCPLIPPKGDHGDCDSPCNLFTPKNVTLVVRNILRQQHFEETVALNCNRYKVLWDMLIEAANQNSKFRFSATYFGEQLGFFIDKINGVAGNWTLDQTYWEILDGNNTQTPVGVSSYVPKDGETVTFNFTTGGHTG